MRNGQIIEDWVVIVRFALMSGNQNWKKTWQKLEYLHFLRGANMTAVGSSKFGIILPMIMF